MPGEETPDTEIIINIHYHRPDNDYDMWSVWLWATGWDGVDYAFSQYPDEHGVVASVVFPAGTEEVGFIVRTMDWLKDTPYDRFIDLSDFCGGTVDVYVESGVEEFEVVY